MKNKTEPLVICGGLLTLMLLASCSLWITGPQENIPQQLAPPVISYDPADYPRSVTITAETGATIYYTTDGTTPIVDEGQKYTGAFQAGSLEIQVKAIAVKEGFQTSDVTVEDIVFMIV